jgi:hypothetical protein
MNMGTFLGIAAAAALGLSAASRPVIVYHYHVPARHHVVATHAKSAPQSQYVQNFRNEILAH